MKLYLLYKIYKTERREKLIHLQIMNNQSQLLLLRYSETSQFYVGNKNFRSQFTYFHVNTENQYALVNQIDTLSISFSLAKVDGYKKNNVVKL